ncbi:MAG: hypothetical protein JWP37_4545 [Mucilaginibacter sp.]|nr:hypothetical protein [Mucilaginibacter sp.]
MKKFAKLIILIFLCLNQHNAVCQNKVMAKVNYYNLLNEGLNFSHFFSVDIDNVIRELAKIKGEVNGSMLHKIFGLPIIDTEDTVYVANCSWNISRMRTNDSLIAKLFLNDSYNFIFKSNREELEINFILAENKTVSCLMTNKIWNSSSYGYQRCEIIDYVKPLHQKFKYTLVKKIKCFCAALLTK